MSEIASERLRTLAAKNEYLFDESFRSPQGLFQRLRSIVGVFESNELSSTQAAMVFTEAVSLYKNDRNRYEEIFASKSNYAVSDNDDVLASVNKDNLQKERRKQHMAKDKKADNAFFQWLDLNVSPSVQIDIQHSYAQINSLLMKSKALRQPIFETQSTDDIKLVLGQIKQLFGNKRTRNTASNLLSEYLTYLQENETNSKKMQVVPVIEVQDGWVLFDFDNAKVFERTRPCYCSVAGEKIEGKNWSRILVGLVEHELEKKNPAIDELFEKSLMSDRSDRSFLLKNKLEGLHCAQLSNGYWININYNIPRIMEMIGTLCLHFGYQKEQVLLYGSARGSASVALEESYVKQQGKERAPVPLTDDNTDLQKEAEKIILEADLGGMTLETLAQNIPSASIVSLKNIRSHSDKIIAFYGSMIHVDALVGLDDAAEKFHKIIEKLLIKNNGYVSSAQLFEYARAEMQMFLNDNDISDERKVFCIVKFLFDKIDWHGYHYEFSSGRHISRGGNERVRTNMDVFEKFARDQGGTFQWDDLLRYLDKVGIKPNNLRVQMEINSKPIFFYYSSDELITAESMQMDDEWMNRTKSTLKKLFSDVGDHIVIRDIVSYWYEQLPELPHRIRWTPILLQYVLRFYGDKLEARTVHSEMPQQYDAIHSLLVRQDSELHTFGDAVVAYVVDNNIEERHFQAEQLRRLLVYGKLIGELELIGNMPRAIGNDSRFAWDTAGENVNIRV